MIVLWVCWYVSYTYCQLAREWCKWVTAPLPFGMQGMKSRMKELSSNLGLPAGANLGLWYDDIRRSTSYFSDPTSMHKWSWSLRARHVVTPTNHCVPCPQCYAQQCSVLQAFQLKDVSCLIRIDVQCIRFGLLGRWQILWLCLPPSPTQKHFRHWQLVWAAVVHS